MAVISAIIIVRARMASEQAIGARGGIVAKALAEAGLRQGTRMWRNGDARVQDRRYSCQTDTGILHIDVVPAASRLDINLANEATLEAFFQVLGADPASATTIAAYIADYRDTDRTPRMHGGEDQAYEAAGLSYGPKNDVFETVAELAHIPVISGALYAKAYTHLTVRGNLSPDMLTADDVVKDTVSRARVDLMDSLEASPRTPARSDPRGAPPQALVPTRSSPIRVRSSAHGKTGGFYVLDAEIVGSVSAQTYPFIARLDIGSVEPGEFSESEDEALPPCDFRTAP